MEEKIFNIRFVIWYFIKNLPCDVSWTQMLHDSAPGCLMHF